MNQQNELIRRNLAAATGAVFALNDLGCTIESVTVDGPHPVVVLDQAPHTVLQGARRVTKRLLSGRVTHTEARLAGCRVLWIESPAQRSGVVR